MMIRTLQADSPRERARIHVVYALMGTVFFMPLNLFAMEAFFLVAVLMSARFIWKYGMDLAVPRRLVWPAAAFALAALLSLTGAPHALMGLAFYAFTILQYILLYLLVIWFIQGRKERRLLLKCLIAGAIVVVLYGFYQYAHMLTLHEEQWVDNSAFPLLRRRMYSTLYNPNLLSAFLLMMLGVTASLGITSRHRNHQWLYLAFLGGLMLCLVLTYSRGAWISVCALVIFFGFVWDKRLWLTLLVVPLIMFFYHGGVANRLLSIFSSSGADTSVSMRLEMWEAAVKMTLDHPFLGIGWGRFKYVYPVYNELIQEAGITIFHAHNMFLNILAETGIIGSIFCWWFYFGNLWHSFTYLRHSDGQGGDRALAMAIASAVVSIAICGLTDYDLFSTQISLTLWLLAGLFANLYKEYQKRMEKSLRNNSQ